MSVEKTFCTTREAAKLLGVSLTTVQNWSEAGLLDFWKTEGGHRRISRDSVTRLLTETVGRSSTATRSGCILGRRFRLRILVVDDDPALARMYQRRLAAWSMSPVVDTARDGFEGLLKVGRQRPHLVVADLQMPFLDGYQMIRTLRDRSDCAEMSIVAVSGLAPTDVVARGGLPGEIPVFPKPVPFDQLEAIAERVCKQRSRPVIPRIRKGEKHEKNSGR